MDLTPYIKEGLSLLQKARYSFAVLIFGIILWKVSDWFGLEDVREEYNKAIRIGTIFAGCVWIAELLANSWGELKAALNARTERNTTLANLDLLNSSEARLVVRAVEVEKSQTFSCSPNTDEASSLVAKGLLIPVPVSTNSSFAKPYTVPRFVWDRVNKASVLEKIKKRIPAK